MVAECHGYDNGITPWGGTWELLHQWNQQNCLQGLQIQVDVMVDGCEILHPKMDESL